MLRRLLAGALVVSGPTAPATIPQTVIPPNAIHQVICFADKGDIWAGTAFRVGRGLMLSVNHVVSEGKCYIDGQPIDILWKSPTSDFAMLGGGDGEFLKVDCGGFVKGRKYIAIGYARGADFTTAVELVATGENDGAQAILAGILTMIPGQSGGPVIDEETGSVVGTVNADDFQAGLSWSTPLKGTPVCGNDIA